MKTDKTDLLVIFFGITSISILLYLIISDFSRSDSLSGKTVVGTITFRYKEAQRKSSKSVLWKNLEQNDSAFNYDSIRTDELSETIVHLKNGQDIELDPDSMIVIEYTDNEEGIRLLKGSIIVKNPNYKTTVYSGKTRIIDFEKQIRITNSKEITTASSDYKFSIETNGKIKNFLKGVVNVISGNPELLATGPQLEKPEDNARFFSDANKLNVSFTWNSKASSTLLIYSSHNMEVPLISQTTANGKMDILLTEGMYYWKVKEGINFSAPRKLRIIQREKIRVFSPENEVEIFENAKIHFNWSKDKLTNYYLLQIAKDEKFNTIISEHKTFKNNVLLKLPAGEYYWKITSRGIQNFSDNASPVYRLKTIPESKPSPSLPVNAISKPSIAESEKTSFSLVSPRTGQTIDMSKSDSIIFRWKTDAKGRFKFRLYSSKNQLLHEQIVQTQFFRFSDLSKLDVGKFYWEVELLDKNSASNKLRSGFSIMLSKELDKPELN